jgi:NDP-sugar pyrophosphorylase family protein
MIEDLIGQGDAFGLRVEYSADGPLQLGTAGAIRKALPLLGDAFFTIYGDSYLTCDYRAVQECFLSSGKAGLMTVFRNEGLWDTSNVEFGGGKVVVYDKRTRTPRMRHIDYGLGVFHRRVFDRLPPGPCDLAAVYQDLLAYDDLAAFEVAERFYETGSFEGIQSLSELLTAGAQVGERTL